MHKWLGVAFLVAGIVSFWQTYSVLYDRDALWEDENQYRQSQTEIPERTPAWDREQQLQALWGILGGISGVLFGLLFLIVQF